MAFILTAARAYAEDISVPSPQEMATLINYDRPVTLSVKEEGPMPTHEWGNVIIYGDTAAKPKHSIPILLLYSQAELYLEQIERGWKPILPRPKRN